MPTWAISAGCQSGSHGSRWHFLRSCSTTLDWPHYPLVAFATVATVIASQAIISGVFSLTQQAIQLGFLPRMQIWHTTSHTIGQIYVPVVNWLLAAATLGAVIGFGTSDALAGAYGIAVSLL